MSSSENLLRRVGRWLRPLVDPDASERLEREADLARRVAEIDAAVSRLAGQTANLSRRIGGFERSWPSELRQSIATLQHATRRQAAVSERLLRASQNRGEREAMREHVMRRLQAAARRGGPVLVGPWTGEVGFELLYWAPFVRWAIRKFRIAPERVTLLSRGGTASWYGLDGAAYTDVFTFCTTDEYRERTTEAKKQRAVRSFDRDILRRARATLGGTNVSVIHPALMYSMYFPYWKQQESVAWVIDYADFRRIEPPVLPELEGRLPEKYIAVRLYFSDCFPDTPSNRAVAAGLVQSISAEMPVVLLGPGLRFDDHYDFSVPASHQVLSLEDLMRPESNLAVQTAVIGRARAFIGTYGGFSYLAPLCGVNTLALYSERNYFVHHLEFARMVFDHVGADPFTSIDVASVPLLRHLSASAATTVPQAGRP